MVLGFGSGLWKHGDFMRFWLGQSVSQFSSQVTLLALPTIAIITLHVSVFLIGLLGAVEFVPYPALGLFAGVWVDRYRRKPMMIVCNIGRFVSLLTIPVAFLLNSLTVLQVFAVAGVNGVFAVFFDTAYASYLPSLVGTTELVEGNSKLQTSASAATVVGPTMAGILIGLVGGAISILTDAAGYLVSTIAMLTISRPEAGPREGAGEGGTSIYAEIKEGLSLTARTPVLALITLCTMTANFGNGIAQAVYLYFIYNQLGLSPFIAGVALTFGGLGLLLGALTATKVAARVGLGRALAVSLLAGFGWLGYPLALVLPPIPVLVVFSFISSVGSLIFSILGLSLVQKITPNRVLGRMNATRRTFSRGVIPLGSILGGLLGQATGLPSTIVVGGVISGGAFLWMLYRPVYTLK